MKKQKKLLPKNTEGREKTGGERDRGKGV